MNQAKTLVVVFQLPKNTCAVDVFLASQDALKVNMSVSVPIDFSDDHHEDHDRYEEHVDHKDLDHQDHHVDNDHHEAHDNFEDHDEHDDHCEQ